MVYIFLILISMNFLMNIPIIMNKFYYFSFTFYCVKSSNKEKQDLISGSFIISFYLFIWTILFKYIIINFIPDTILIIIQIVFSSIICTIILIHIIIKNCCFKGMFWRTFFYLFFFIFACGGIWFFGCECCICPKCCTCCKYFATKEDFDKCCNCGRYDNCCVHELSFEKFEIQSKCKRLREIACCLNKKEKTKFNQLKIYH